MKRPWAYFAMGFFGNPPIEYFADGVSVDDENLVCIALESWWCAKLDADQ